MCLPDFNFFSFAILIFFTHLPPINIPVFVPKTPNLCKLGTFVCEENPLIDIPKSAKKHLKRHAHTRIPSQCENPPPPVHNLRSQPCTIILWSGVLPFIFCSHRAFLSKLTSAWPQLTPAWSLTPAKCFTLEKGFPTNFDCHRSFLRQIDLRMAFWPLMGSLWKAALGPQGPALYPHANFQLHTSKHDEKHQATHTYILSLRF